MNWLPTIDDPKVKGYCSIFNIDNNGIVGGHKFDKGKKIPVIGGDRRNRSVFMECPNRERSMSCAIGFASDTPFHDMKVGTLNNISLVMVRGLITDDNGAIKIVLHRWKGDNYCDNLYDEINQYKRDHVGFIRRFFVEEPEEFDSESIHIIYVNQIGGTPLRPWTQSPNTYIDEHGRLIYKAKSSPDVLWKGNQDPFTGKKKSKKFLCPPPPTKLGGSFLKNRSTLDDEIGPKLMQLEQKNSIRVLYGKKREYESLLGRTERGKPKVYLLPNQRVL